MNELRPAWPNMVRDLRFIAVSVSITLGLSLSACSSQETLSLSGEETDIPPCASTGEIKVADLVTSTLPDCFPVGSTLLFPSGASLVIESAFNSASATSSDDIPVTSGYETVGKYGVVAIEHGPDCVDLQTWGSAEATAKLADAFGSDWACSPSTQPSNG